MNRLMALSTLLMVQLAYAQPATDTTKPVSIKGAAVTPQVATINFVVMPWGEVFVEGKGGSITPPMKSIKLEPGAHRDWR